MDCQVIFVTLLCSGMRMTTKRDKEHSELKCESNSEAIGRGSSFIAWRRENSGSNVLAKVPYMRLRW
ncbi:unnamed protein product [Urochloa humidicola]